jgi:hypothetical protein
VAWPSACAVSGNCSSNELYSSIRVFRMRESRSHRALLQAALHAITARFCAIRTVTPFSSPASVIQQMAHFGAPICSTMPVTLTPASAPRRRRIAGAQGRALNREAHLQMGFSRSMTSESAGLFIDGRRPGFTFPPVNYTEIVCEFVHLLCGNRCAKRAPHLVDLDTPFVYSQRRLS